MFTQSSKTNSNKAHENSMKQAKIKTVDNNSLQEVLANPSFLSPKNVLQLQRTIGNKAVIKLLKSQFQQQSVSRPMQLMELEEEKLQMKQDVLQKKLKVDANGKMLEKDTGNRYGFNATMHSKMGCGFGEDLCHTVSYHTICNGVMQPINECLAKRCDDTAAYNYLLGIIETIAPSGWDNSHPTIGTNPNKIWLIKYCQNMVDDSKVLATDIKNELKKPLYNMLTLLNYANSLIANLNNCPSNLRPGDGTTNKSIGNAIDASQGNITTLKAGTKVKPGNKAEITLLADKKVLLLHSYHALQVRNLFTMTAGPGNDRPYFWTNGKDIQSSDVSGMTTGFMGPLKTTVPIAFDDGGGKYILTEDWV